MKFKNDILAYFRDRDNFYLEKLKELKTQADITDKNLDNLSDVMKKNFSTILSNQAETTTKLDKIKTFDAFVNKSNDKYICEDYYGFGYHKNSNKRKQKKSKGSN